MDTLAKDQGQEAFQIEWKKKSFINSLPYA